MFLHSVPRETYAAVIHWYINLAPMHQPLYEDMKIEQIM